MPASSAVATMRLSIAPKCSSKELWMPEIQPDGVLPQDDSFMVEVAINLAKYKAAAGKQTILLDYSREK
ncbi:hypothetical protein ACLB1O_10930 [Escherichia coli]